MPGGLSSLSMARTCSSGLRAGASVLALLACALGAGTAAAAGDSAQALQQHYQQHQSQRSDSAGEQAIEVESAELDEGMQGDVYALAAHSLDQVRQVLEDPAQWCTMLLLHINNRACRLGQAGGATTLQLSLVRRYDQPVEQAFELALNYQVVADEPDYLAVALHSADGPLGTSSHRVLLEAIAVSPQQTYLHLRYGYDHNALARVATQAYLATFGSDKVGFTVTGTQSDGQKDYIGGLRGLVERNAMRYYLTVAAYLACMDEPPARQHDARLRTWFAMAERYPRQLHEIDLATYLALKQTDRERDGAK